MRSGVLILGRLHFGTIASLLFLSIETCGDRCMIGDVFCFSSAGSTWSWTRVIVWRIITVSSLRSSTHTTWLPEGSCSPARPFRTNYPSSGPCWTSCCPPSSKAAVHSSSGSTLRSPWPERRYNVHQTPSACRNMFMYRLPDLVLRATLMWTTLHLRFYFVGRPERRRDHPDHPTSAQSAPPLPAQEA